MSCQVVSFISMCKRRKNTEEDDSCPDLSREQGQHLSVSWGLETASPLSSKVSIFQC